MPKVAVTGSSGKLGRHVVRELLDAGWDVVGLDSRGGAGQGERSVTVDLTDFGQTFGALNGVDEVGGGFDAVVHLAAIPAPGLRPDAVTFHNNMACTYNVFSAAVRSGVRRIVWASSETVLGLPFDEPPPYVPVDEEYAPRPNSSYSLCKTLEEELARQLCRWEPELTMVGLRFSNVMDPQDYAGFPAMQKDPNLRKWNLWGYIDGRDGAQAVRLGLEYPAKGADIFVIASPDTVMERPTSELLAACFPDVPVRGPLGEHETLLGIGKARRLLGYAPRYSWRDVV
jgi:nucleoside-diphosphate-sugar epimerase